MKMSSNKIFIITVLIAGVFVMLNTHGCSPAFRYETYSSKNPMLNIEIEPRRA